MLTFFNGCHSKPSHVLERQGFAGGHGVVTSIANDQAAGGASKLPFFIDTILIEDNSVIDVTLIKNVSVATAEDKLDRVFVGCCRSVVRFLSNLV